VQEFFASAIVSDRLHSIFDVLLRKAAFPTLRDAPEYLSQAYKASENGQFSRLGPSPSIQTDRPQKNEKMALKDVVKFGS
jgi:hypothetical protein